MKNIVIYTTNTWPHCHTAKDYLVEKGCTFTEKNVSENPAYRKEMIEKGLMGVPMIYVDDELVKGFDKNRLDQILD